MSRPDVTVMVGRMSLLVSGDRARELLDQLDINRTPSLSGWQCSIEELPRLSAYAEARGWSVVVHDTKRATT